MGDKQRKVQKWVHDDDDSVLKNVLCQFRKVVDKLYYFIFLDGAIPLTHSLIALSSKLPSASDKTGSDLSVSLLSLFLFFSFLFFFYQTVKLQTSSAMFFKWIDINLF